MVRYFGEYELLEEIARGSTSVVYKAKQIKLNRLVALKTILSRQLAAVEDVQRFHSKAKAAAYLEHPGIVPIYEVGGHEGQHYFSMAFVDGPSLGRAVAPGPLPSREAAQIAQAVSEAMAYAHDRGVIHRDLKPANILFAKVSEQQSGVFHMPCFSWRFSFGSVSIPEVSRSRHGQPTKPRRIEIQRKFLKLYHYRA